MPAFSPLPCVASLLLVLCLGCAHAGGSASRTRVDFFGPAGAPGDVWYAKVDEWQSRARREGTHNGSALIGSGLLREKMASFAARERRDLAVAINMWSRLVARSFYIGDYSDEPEFDHWPTVSEILANDGDDCDGLDLIPYQLLREFGFPSNQVYRLIVRRESDRANHMVTVWFEDGDDPWVLDATGAMSAKWRRFSDVDDEAWTPVKMFNDELQFEVVERPARRSAARD